MSPAGRVALVGAIDVRLRALIGDLLAEIQVDLVDAAWSDRPDLVIVLVDAVGPGEAVRAARARGGGSPVLALLPLSDDRWQRTSLAAGAAGCWALDTSIDRLKDAVVALLAGRR